MCGGRLAGQAAGLAFGGGAIHQRLPGDGCARLLAGLIVLEA